MGFNFGFVWCCLWLSISSRPQTGTSPVRHGEQRPLSDACSWLLLLRKCCLQWAFRSRWDQVYSLQSYSGCCLSAEYGLWIWDHSIAFSRYLGPTNMAYWPEWVYNTYRMWPAWDCSRAHVWRRNQKWRAFIFLTPHTFIFRALSSSGEEGLQT